MKLSKKFMAGALASLLAMSMTVSVFAETASPATAAKEMADGKATVVAADNGGVSDVTVKKGAAAVTKVDTATKKLEFGTITDKDGNVAEVTSIAKNALKGSKATSLKVATDKAFTFNGNAVNGATKLKSIEVTSSKVTLKASALANAKALKTLKLSGITSSKKLVVKAKAFKKMKNNGKKFTIYVSKDTSKKELNKIKKALKAKGFKGKVKKLKK